MRIPLTLTLAAILILPATAQDKTPAKPTLSLESLTARISYAIGHNIGDNLKGDQADIDINAFSKGLEDGLKGAEALLTQEEMASALHEFQQLLQQKRVEQAQAAKTEGEAFLAQNKQKEGVVTLPSGLQYQVIKTGDGATPKATDTVKVHYNGTFINGEVFDSSIERNEPVTFPVNGVIQGWVEALQLMPVGSKWRLFVPSDLAYGSQGRPGIPPNSVLLFDVELLGIEGAE